MIYPLLFRVNLLVSPTRTNLADLRLHDVVDLLLNPKQRLLLLSVQLALSLSFDPVKWVQGLRLIPTRDENLLEDLSLADLLLLRATPDCAVLLLKVDAVGLIEFFVHLVSFRLNSRCLTGLVGGYELASRFRIEIIQINVKLNLAFRDRLRMVFFFVNFLIEAERNRLLQRLLSQFHLAKERR